MDVRDVSERARSAADYREATAKVAERVTSEMVDRAREEAKAKREAAARALEAQADALARIAGVTDWRGKYGSARAFLRALKSESSDQLDAARSGYAPLNSAQRRSLIRAREHARRKAEAERLARQKRAEHGAYMNGRIARVYGG